MHREEIHAFVELGGSAWRHPDGVGRGVAGRSAVVTTSVESVDQSSARKCPPGEANGGWKLAIHAEHSGGRVKDTADAARYSVPPGSAFSVVEQLFSNKARSCR